MMINKDLKNPQPASPLYQETVDAITQWLSIPTITVYQTDTDNACATYDYFGGRVIAYNRYFMGSLAEHNRFAPVFVLAHEIYHHHRGHLHISTHSWHKEFDADACAAYTMRHFDVDLTNTLAFFDFIAHDPATSTHPSGTDRRANAYNGWVHADKQLNPDKYKVQTADVVEGLAKTALAVGGIYVGYKLLEAIFGGNRR